MGGAEVVEMEYSLTTDFFLVMKIDASDAVERYEFHTHRLQSTTPPK
jgi:hypothetical protein